ncbi:MAG: phosphonopyruvate decarboxylase [Defluviitaleaceae bacterium]|nr:phosphonopyruvate decarboxylase [Defluviitaleaceae bacterium]MCL2274432.1 phosphonopyruvate decarboxylase [Defluviitaleaceae bacterium]
MNPNIFANYEFFTGVPDSQLKPLCDWILDTYSLDPQKHIVAANEGNAVAIAAGYHLATGKVPVVYLQNSGIGNITNPVASLINHRVYGIPMLFIVGWRGEPNVPDEPQHVFQGEITLAQLECLEIEACVLEKNTTDDDFNNVMKRFEQRFAQGKSAAFVIRKGALKYECKNNCAPVLHGQISREEAIRHIAKAAMGGLIVSTTGKASRELYEIREQNKQGHEADFLTVGSMGHSASIALGIALHKPSKRIWVIDGDGAMLMHTGAMAIIGAAAPKNLVHIIINNAAHESVGGMPTAVRKIDMPALARGFGYSCIKRVSTIEELTAALAQAANNNELSLIEVITTATSRDDLGRPKGTPQDNKVQFMDNLMK